MIDKTCTVTRDEEFVDEDGREVPTTTAECDDCGATTESRGTGPASTTRCLAMMRDECGCLDADRAFFVETV